MALISDAVCTRKLEALLVNHMDLVICNDYDVYVCMHKAITSPYGLTPSLHCTTGTSTNKRRMKSLMTPATTLCGACKLKALLQDFVFDNTTIADGQSFRNLRERPSDVHVVNILVHLTFVEPKLAITDPVPTLDPGIL